MRLNLYFIVLLLFVLASCQTTELQQAIKLAGKNGSELQKVLDHYSHNPKDSLKYRAACFLIENMRWHYGKSVKPSPMLWDLFLLEDTLITPIMQNPYYWKIERSLYGYKYGAKKILVRKAISQSEVSHEAQIDLLNLDADFLIETIETAFMVKDLDWCKYLSFNDFCEYILSYRLNNEPVFSVRKRLNEHYSYLYYTDSLKRDPYPTIALFNKRMKLFHWDNMVDNVRLPDFGFYNILYWETSNMTCSNHVVIEGQLMRSIGIPIIEVFTPKGRDANTGHSWCAFPEPNGDLTLFSAGYQKPGDVSVSQITAWSSKLYMKTFASQAGTPFFLKAEGEDLPTYFSTPCIKDVTGKLVPTRNIEMDLSTTLQKNNICWFSIFIKGNWIPIGWGTLNKDKTKVMFKDIPIGLTGMACFLVKGRTIPAGKLITVTTEGVDYICPDGEKTNMLLKRKFTEKQRLHDFAGKMIGVKIQGANTPDFSDTVTLYTITDTLKPYFQDLTFNNKKKFRYYRFHASSGTLYMAEIEFITEHNLPGTVVASKLPVFDINKSKQKKMYKFRGKSFSNQPDTSAFDGDMLTYTLHEPRWVGLDIGHPEIINRVRVAARNANNGIVVGDKYQLYYWDDRWVDAGVKKAKYNFVEFKDMPANTLYWLRNLDHGTEEQPFFYKNGKQVFSNK